MQYTNREIRKFIWEAAQGKFTDALVESMIQELYPENQHDIVRKILSQIDSIVDIWTQKSKLIEREGKRIHIAALMYSSDSLGTYSDALGNGDLERLEEAIQLAKGDYRDLLSQV